MIRVLFSGYFLINSDNYKVLYQSSIKIVGSGVPQGTSLGPLFFLNIYEQNSQLVLINVLLQNNSLNSVHGY